MQQSKLALDKLSSTTFKFYPNQKVHFVNFCYDEPWDNDKNSFQVSFDSHGRDPFNERLTRFRRGGVHSASSKKPRPRRRVKQNAVQVKRTSELFCCS